MTFVDASAIVAIMTNEPDSAEFKAVLLASPSPITSAMAIFETALAISRKREAPIHLITPQIDRFLRAVGVQIVEINAQHAELALDAHARYGKGRGHPAQLNMGDCFSYAVAKSHNASLLFKGDDFSQTDIPPAADRI